MKTVLIGAGSDLGSHIDGARLGPKRLIDDLASFHQGKKILLEQNSAIIKSRSLADKRKNEVEVLKFNKALYDTELQYLNQGYFPITIGGDHSIAIASSLASMKKNTNIGMIWIDIHSNYHTYQSTPTGNLYELALASINGYHCRELSSFHEGEWVPSKNTVIVGAKSIDKKERENLKYSGVTVFTMDDIRTQGLEAVMEQAFLIAAEKTNGVHISFDLGVFSSEFSLGVSIPEEDGLTEEEGIQILDQVLMQIDKITSFDLVEFNPMRDDGRKTEQIAVNILAKTIMSAEKKESI